MAEAAVADRPVHERTERFGGRVSRWREQGGPMVGWRFAVLDERTGIVVAAEIKRAPFGQPAMAIDAMRARLRQAIAAFEGEARR